MTLYTTHCPKCKVLQLKLQKAGVSFNVCEDMIEMERLGFNSSPVLEVNGVFYNFKDAVDFLKGDN